LIVFSAAPPGSLVAAEELGDEAGTGFSAVVVWAKELSRQKSIRIKAVVIFIIQTHGYYSTPAQSFFGYKHVFNF
jgi:hypothetical protein